VLFVWQLSKLPRLAVRRSGKRSEWAHVRWPSNGPSRIRTRRISIRVTVSDLSWNGRVTHIFLDSDTVSTVLGHFKRNQGARYRRAQTVSWISVELLNPKDLPGAVRLAWSAGSQYNKQVIVRTPLLVLANTARSPAGHKNHRTEQHSALSLETYGWMKGSNDPRCLVNRMLLSSLAILLMQES
jgi:hypothetical protein